MDNLQQDIEALISSIAERLLDAEVPPAYIKELSRLVEEVYQPCVVAVVGQVNAGKSTFINALLGADLATVGTTETTATINHFRYGKISDQLPARCFWRGGKIENIDMAFLQSLQGHTQEILQRADGIDHLEYYMQSPYLEQVTLVDTPGTGTSVTEHGKSTAEFLHLEQELRRRHNSETETIGSKADAVIFLIGSVARATDQSFLDDFLQVTQGSSKALNAIGVMARIDQDPAIGPRRKELAEKIATQLKGKLNTVVPVSAALERALDLLLENDGERLKALAQAMRRIPEADLPKLLGNPKLYHTLDPQRYPIPLAERKELQAGISPWTVFSTIASAVADTEKDLATIVEELRELAGFEQLRRILDLHFFSRSRFLRCHRILNDVQRSIASIRTRYVERLYNKEKRDKKRIESFLAFIEQARQAGGDLQVSKQLEIFVRKSQVERSAQLENLLAEIERELEAIVDQLFQYNSDFEALRHVLEESKHFPATELDELQQLLGLYSLELEKRLPADKLSLKYAGARQLYWRGVQDSDENPTRRIVAEKAVARYGHIMAYLIKQ